MRIPEMRDFGLFFHRPGIVSDVARFRRRRLRSLTQADRTLAHDLLKQLIETNTSHSVGSTTAAAEAMRKRLLDAGFAPADITIDGPDARHGNIVVRLPRQARQHHQGPCC